MCLSSALWVVGSRVCFFWGLVMDQGCVSFEGLWPYIWPTFQTCSTLSVYSFGFPAYARRCIWYAGIHEPPSGCMQGKPCVLVFPLLLLCRCRTQDSWDPLLSFRTACTNWTISFPVGLRTGTNVASSPGSWGLAFSPGSWGRTAAQCQPATPL